MRLSIVLTLTATCLGGLTTSSLAAEKAGVTMTDKVRVGDRTLVLNGMGLREATWLDIDVYVAGLYLEKVSSDPAAIISSKQAKRIVMVFKRDVERSDILKAWHTGFEKNAKARLAEIKPQMDTLDAWMPAFEEDDVLIFTYLPDQGVQVDVNNVRKGVLRGEAFAQSLFAIWFGPHPPSGDLKKGMLGTH
jgi:hypothetical protein